MSEVEVRELYLAKRRAGYLKNKDKISEQNRLRYRRDKHLFAERKRKWKADNPEKYKESIKKWNDKDREAKKIKAKAVRDANKNELNRRQREKRKNRTQEQKDKDSAYRKKYNDKNRERLIEYRKKTKDSRRPRKRELHRTKYRTDAKYKMTHNMRSRIKTALRGNMKDDTSMRLLGCTISFFKQYFESLFTDGMTWDAVLSGEIHIDHIIPCAKFDLTNVEDQRRCFHYSNLQPLWGIDNLKKGAKIWTIQKS